MIHLQAGGTIVHHGQDSRTTWVGTKVELSGAGQQGTMNTSFRRCVPGEGGVSNDTLTAVYGCSQHRFSLLLSRVPQERDTKEEPPAPCFNVPFTWTPVCQALGVEKRAVLSCRLPVGDLQNTSEG
jgi:hypothetical protein